jgi:hypothetical protein
MDKVLFNEDQRFTQSWIAILLYLILILNSGLFGYGIYKQIILGQSWGNTPMSDTALVITFLLVMAVFTGLLILFHRAVLKTTITTESLRFKFPPFFFKEKVIRADEIHQAEIRKYKPILEYGGWGIRIGISRGKAYNVKGNIGIQLYLKNGKKILIGTQKKDQADWAIKKMLKHDE